MNRDLMIIGAGGASQEIAEAIEQVNRDRQQWNLLGFLDDNPAKQGADCGGYPVLGPLAAVVEHPDAFLVMGVANSETPLVRQQIAARLALPVERYATIIHPACHVSPRARVGHGSVLLQAVVVPHEVRIGNHVLVQQLTSVGHDDVLEDYVTVAPAAAISGFVRIGAGAFIGANASIMPRVTIGAGAVVGIGAVVLTDVEAHTTVLGNPARRLPSFGPA